MSSQAFANTDATETLRLAREGNLEALWKVAQGDSFEPNDAKAAYTALLAEASNNNPEAQWLIGRLCTNTARDDREIMTVGFIWFERALENGSQNAAHSLGRQYLIGYYIEQDTAKGLELLMQYYDNTEDVNWHILGMILRLSVSGPAPGGEKLTKWLEAKAQQGSTSAMSLLEDIFENGLGVEPDYDKSLAWYNKAVNDGDKQAQQHLADYYPNGKYIKDIYEITRKAEQGDSQSQFLLGLHFEMRQPQDIENAVKWYNKAAVNGSIDAIYELAGLYLDFGQIYGNDPYNFGLLTDSKLLEDMNGQWPSFNPKDGLEWLIKAAEINRSANPREASMLFALGYSYTTGVLGDKNYAEALKWLNAAYKTDSDEMALYELGRIYADETYTQYNYIKAMDFFMQAAEGVDPVRSRAIYQIGKLYELGKGVKQDFAEAAAWYAKEDYWGSEYALGMLYLNGNGVEQDIPKAMALFEKAILVPQAQLELARLYHEGIVVPKDDITAYAWLTKCLEYEIVKLDQKLMAELDEMKTELEAKLTLAELDQARDKLDERVIKKSTLLNSLNY